MDKYILVTGGAGYIGSHTCKALASNGYLPITLDNLIYGHKKNVKWGPFIKGDILDRNILHQCFQKYKIDAVIHFAAFAYVGESVDDPGKYYYNNVSGTINLLEAMREYACNKLVFSSTCAVYGHPQHTPISENHPFKPINPYGRSKLMIEQILTDYKIAYDLQSISLRYFNAAGADPEGDLGEEHNPEPHLIPLTLKATIDPSHNLSVFGSNHDTPDGTCIRDFIHVTDLAHAHILALNYLENQKGSAAFNLGTGKGYSVRQVIDAVSKIVKRPVKWKFQAKREGDPGQLIADAALAKSELGWEPKYQQLDQIITHAYNWLINHNDPS